MATQKASELPFCHRHTECTATLGAIPSERDPETSWATPTHLVNEKISTSKQVRKPEPNNKVLLYSTGNYIQYPVINHNGKEYIKKKNVKKKDYI